MDAFLNKKVITDGKERRKKKVYKKLADVELPDEEMDEYKIVQTLLNLNLDNFSEVYEKVKSYEILTENIHFAYQVMVHFSTIRPKKIGLYAQLMVDLIKFFDDKMPLFDIEMKSCSLAQLVGRTLPYTENELQEVDTLKDQSIDLLLESYKPTDLRYYFFYDDLEKFKKHSLKQGFNFNQKLRRECEYVENEDDPEELLTILHFTSFHGSENCFQFAVLNGTKVVKSVRHHAVAGGNKIIVHYLAQHGVDFSDCAKSALEFHHDDLVDWIMYFYPNQELDLISGMRYFNHRAIYYCLANKTDDIFNLPDTSYLHIICQHGYVNLLDYFVKKGLNIEKTSTHSILAEGLPEVPFIFYFFIFHLTFFFLFNVFFLLVWFNSTSRSC